MAFAAPTLVTLSYAGPAGVQRGSEGSTHVPQDMHTHTHMHLRARAHARKFPRTERDTGLHELRVRTSPRSSMHSTWTPGLRTPCAHPPGASTPTLALVERVTTTAALRWIGCDGALLPQQPEVLWSCGLRAAAATWLVARSADDGSVRQGWGRGTAPCPRGHIAHARCMCTSH